MNDLVSIVVPNYNSEKFLKETIDSVLAQTYKNWELLIVDDCSTDGSLEIIRSYKDPRIQLFQNETNCGAAYSRNVALQKAQGKWVAFLDSDDLWTEEKLERQIAFMQENGYLFSYTDYERIDEASKPLGEVITGPKKIGRRKMLRYNYLGCLTVMYNREALGLFQVEEEIANGRNDYALWLKISKRAKCYRLNETLAKYRMRTSSLSHGSFKKLLRYQYQLFRISEKMNPIRATYHVFVNLFFGTVKKIFYKNKR